MKYLLGCLIIAKHILLSIVAFSYRLKLIACICTDSTTWLSILLSFFAKIQLTSELFLQNRDSYEVCN